MDSVTFFSVTEEAIDGKEICKFVCECDVESDTAAAGVFILRDVNMIN